MLIASYWQFVVHGQGAIKFVEVSLKVESAWATVGARLKPGQRK